MRFSRNANSGFTKVELLVVVVIICGLILLVLPALSKVDVVHQKLSCKNNLRQISLAVVNYHDTYGAYPTGTIPNSELPPEKRLSWMVALLPYVEMDNLYSQIPKDRAWDDDANRKIQSSYVMPYACTEGRYGNNVGLVQPTEYVAISGAGADSAQLPTDDPRSGVIGYSRTIKKEDIRDGLSSTLLAIETSTDLGPWAAGGPSTVRGIDAERQPFIGPNCQFGGNHKTDRSLSRWIRHDCATAAFVDGSVRFLNDSISRETLEALATIAGGDTPGDDY